MRKVKLELTINEIDRLSMILGAYADHLAIYGYWFAEIRKLHDEARDLRLKFLSIWEQNKALAVDHAVCDECKYPIPNLDSSPTGTHHAESCSLHRTQ
jgi:hypothetical protein